MTLTFQRTAVRALDRESACVMILFENSEDRRMQDSLDREIHAYEALLPYIRSQYGSVWALIVHEKLVKTFTEFSFAAQYAVTHHHDDQVLIRHTDERMETAPFVDISH